MSYPLRSFGLMAALVIFSSCAVMQPLHEAEPPETLGPWGFRAAVFTGTSPTIATPLISSDAGSTSISMEGLRLAAGLGRSFQIEGDSFLGNSAEGGSSLALKWQILGDPLFESIAGNTALTLTVRESTGSASGYTSSDISNSNFDDTDLHLSSNDASLVLGNRFTNHFGGYFGAKYISGKVTANYRDVANGPIVQTDTRKFSSYGALGALYIAGTGQSIGFDITLEVQYMQLPSTYTSGNTWAYNMTLLAGLPFRF